MFWYYKQGLVEWMRELKWLLVVVVYMDDQCSIVMYDFFVQYFKRVKICLVYVLLIKEEVFLIFISKDILELIIGILEKIQKKLMDEKLSVVFFGRMDIVKMLFQFIKNCDINVIVYKF